MNGQHSPVDDLAMLVGFKELELLQTRRELVRTRQVLEEVTSGEKAAEASDGERADDIAEPDDASADE